MQRAGHRCGFLGTPVGGRHLAAVVAQDLANARPSTALVASRDLVDLAAILDPKVHVAVWCRPVDERIAAVLQRDECEFGKHSRLVGRRAELTDGSIATLLPEALRAVDPDGVAALAADIHAICEAFAELVCADELLVSLESPEDATCPRFHVDRVGIRLLVTYAGPGTQVLPHEHCDRSWLGDAGHGRIDEETGLMRPGAEIQQFSAFDVVLLKGEAWPGADGFGAVHRSPDPGEQRRVLLRVDMLSQAAPSAENEQ